MTITFSQLIARTTEAAILTTLKTAGAIVSFDIDALPDNSVLRAILVSILPKGLLDFANTITEIAKGGFLDWAADGPYLEMLGEQMFGVERIRLTFATTPCVFTNTSIDNNRYEFFAGQVRVKHATSGKVYKAAAFTLEAPGDSLGRDVATVDVIAEEAGTNSNAAADTITGMVTTFDGVSVTNPAAAFATDLETRSNYIARCRLEAAGASPFGPSQQYERIAKGAKRVDGTPIGVTKIKLIKDTIDGTTTMYMATDGGVPDVDDVTRINELLVIGAVPGGVDFIGAFAATPVTVPITYVATALASAGLTADEIEDLVALAEAALFVEVPIGGWDGLLYAEKIRATIVQAQAAPNDPRPVVNATLSLPAANVDLDDDEVAILGTITPTVNLI